MPNILVVNETAQFVSQLDQQLLPQGQYQLVVAQDAQTAIDCLKQQHFALIIADFDPSQPDSKRLFDFMASHDWIERCIVYARTPSIENSVEAVKLGVFHYLEKSEDPGELILKINQALGVESQPLDTGTNYRTEQNPEINSPPGLERSHLIGQSPAIINVFKTVSKVAASDSTVLITGESGTGKELIARAIHINSDRVDKPMVVINCGAIPGELLESELFGHEKGAFTGAHRTRTGRFELANGGTIFLDEIGDMSPNLQVKLLRVLQEKTFERVGSTQVIKVNIRILAATNKDLFNSIDEGKFREDLYYRLNVIPIVMPPLRDRKEDIPLLVDYFLNRLAERRKWEVKTISDSAMSALMTYNWPGNIRELENMMERLSVLVDGDTIEIADLPEKISNQAAPALPSVETFAIEDGFGFNDAVENYQRDLILKALQQANWVKAKAAELLKMNRTTLVEKIKKMNIAT